MCVYWLSCFSTKPGWCHEEHPLSACVVRTISFSDDCPGYPMTLVRQSVVLGKIDRIAFEAALAETIKRHPILSALVDSRTIRRSSWNGTDHAKPYIDRDYFLSGKHSPQPRSRSQNAVAVSLFACTRVPANRCHHSSPCGLSNRRYD